MALSRAQALDAQADQLTSKGHYGKAGELRLEAAVAYEAAAQCTGDPGASKTLMMLAQRQCSNAKVLEGKAATASQAQAKPAVNSSPQQRTGQLRPRSQVVGRQGQDGLSTLQASRKQLEGASHRRFLRDPQSQSQSQSVSLPTTSVGMQPQQQQTAASSSSSMLDSKMTRRSESPSSSFSPNASIYPEGSFMVLRDDANDADPFRRFNQAVDALLGQMSQPVAFATLPLDKQKKSSAAHKSPFSPGVHVSPPSPLSAAGAAAEESFYVVDARESAHPASPASSRRSKKQSEATLASTKTNEELAQENATLKEALNQLSLQHEQAVSSQRHERNTLKQSIISLRSDIRKESDRVLRVPAHQQGGTALLSQHLPPHLPNDLSDGLDNSNGSSTTEMQAELESLRAELNHAKSSAQKYKNRYDQLREAIKEKRMKKEAAASANLTSSPSAPTNNPSLVPDPSSPESGSPEKP